MARLGRKVSSGVDLQECERHDRVVERKREHPTGGFCKTLQPWLDRATPKGISLTALNADNRNESTNTITTNPKHHHAASFLYIRFNIRKNKQLPTCVATKRRLHIIILLVCAV